MGTHLQFSAMASTSYREMSLIPMKGAEERRRRTTRPPTAWSSPPPLWPLPTTSTSTLCRIFSPGPRRDRGKTRGRLSLERPPPSPLPFPPPHGSPASASTPQTLPTGRASPPTLFPSNTRTQEMTLLSRKHPSSVESGSRSTSPPHSHPPPLPVVSTLPWSLPSPSTSPPPRNTLALTRSNSSRQPLDPDHVPTPDKADRQVCCMREFRGSV